MKSELALDLDKLLKEKDRKNSSDNNQKRKSIQIREKNECHNYDTRCKTDDEKNRDRVDSQLGEIASVSRLQIQRTRKIQEKGTPEDIADLKSCGVVR